MISGKPVSVLCHPQSKEVLPHVQLEILMLQLVPTDPYPVTGHYWKELGLILLTPTLKTFTGIYKVPSEPSLLQAEQAQLPQPLRHRSFTSSLTCFYTSFCISFLKKLTGIKIGAVSDVASALISHPVITLVLFSFLFVLLPRELCFKIHGVFILQLTCSSWILGFCCFLFNWW